MDDREKMIKLLWSHCALISADACPKSSNGKCTILDCATCLADYLIANGVGPVVRCEKCACFEEATAARKWRVNDLEPRN